MPSAELARLTCRVDAHDEDLRVLGDVLVEVKETVDQHTEMLADLGGRLDRVEESLQQHGGMLERHGGMLVEILRRLGPAR